MAKYKYDKKVLKGLTPFPFLGEVKTRTAAIEAAPATLPNSIYNPNILANKLHPAVQHCLIQKVEDHGDVGAARVEHGQTMRLDEQRLAYERLRRDESGIETLHMTHLHLHARFVGQFFQGVGLFGRGHDGLLNEDMLAFPQGF